MPAGYGVEWRQFMKLLANALTKLLCGLLLVGVLMFIFLSSREGFPRPPVCFTHKHSLPLFLANFGV